MSFIFGGNTQLTYDQVQKQREVANALLTANMRTPQNVGEGLSAIGRALAARAIDKRTGREEARLRDEFNAKWGALFSGAGGGSTSYAGGGGSPSGTWTPAAPGPKATESFLGMPDVVEGGHEFTGMPKADPGVIGAKGGLSFGAATMTPQEMLIAGAEARGLDPIDVATAISYETGGKFDPMLSGPTTQWGTHRGLIQFGEPQAQQHGVDFTNSDTAWRSQLNPTSGAIWSYLDGAGVKPGMGLDQIYSAINAGSVGRMGASDANNGGAPGTVADKVAGMGPHRQNAAAFLGGTWTPNPGQGGAPASGGGSVVPMGMDIGALVSLASDPMASPAQKAIIEQLIGQQLAMADPLRQIEMQKAQLELAQLQNPVPGFTQLTPAEVAALGLPPGVYQRGPDGRLDTVEKTQVTVDPIADLKARALAAGLVEGTPEYQQFMLNNGKTEGGMVIESDGQGGFRMVQGAGAGAAAGKPFTEGQSKDIVFATRAEGALATLDQIADALTNRGEAAADWLPMGLGGGMQSDDYQIAKTAGDEFLQAILRKDTGAAITAGEQSLYGETYLPRPGDSPARLKYKAEARKRAVEALKGGMSASQIVAQEKALEKSGTGAAATPAADADGWTTLPNGIKVRVKQ